MKLIIDIPEEIYKASQTVDVKYEDTIQIPLEVIANGTPIPEKHGRLIDADEQESIIEELENICINNEYVLDLLGKLKNASTILEAWGNEE